MASTAITRFKCGSLGPSVSLNPSKQPAATQRRHLVAASLHPPPILCRHLSSAGDKCTSSGQHFASPISADSTNRIHVLRSQSTSLTGLKGKRGLAVRANRTDQVQEASTVPDALAAQSGAITDGLVGEDAGVFDVTAQKTSSWVNFTIVLAVVLAILYVVWIDPTTGFGGKYIDALEGAVGGSHEATIIALLSIFALVHSGGAALRAKAEDIIGARAYRVLFAGLSLPLAVSSVVYFINHRYDGTQLWQLRTVPGAHELVWIVSFISFFFLYPSTFNLLEVAALDKPKLHMWETGILRITRHPQMTGQLLWCLAHTLWIGNSFTLVTSLGLCAHHLFGVWHGDQRLEAKYGDAFRTVKARTSVVPFQAIIEGRQKLPQDWYKECLRVPYFVIVGITLGAYFSHPLMQQGSFWLHW